MPAKPIPTVAVDGENPDEGVIQRAARLLRRGAVIVCPTETFYGLAADASNREACERICILKCRPEDKALPSIVSDLEQLEIVALAITPQARVLARRFWPGPLTLVVTAKLPLAAAAGDGSLAVRASGLALPRLLARELGRPITATSANRSGSPPKTTAAEAASDLVSTVDLVLDAGPSPGGLPSTVVDVREALPKLVREGRIPFEIILDALRVPPFLDFA